MAGGRIEVVDVDGRVRHSTVRRNTDTTSTAASLAEMEKWD